MVLDLLDGQEEGDVVTNVASAALARLSDEDCREFTRRWLPNYVRWAIGRRRAVAGPPEEDEDALPPLAVVSSRVGEPVRHDPWAWLLDRWVSVKPNNWKQLRHCTADDLESVVAAYTKLASANEREATRYDALRERMVRVGARTVEGLPPGEVQKILF